MSAPGRHVGPWSFTRASGTGPGGQCACWPATPGSAFTCKQPQEEPHSRRAEAMAKGGADTNLDLLALWSFVRACATILWFDASPSAVTVFPRTQRESPTCATHQDVVLQASQGTGSARNQKHQTH